MTRPEQNDVSTKPCLLRVSPRKEEQRFRSEGANFALTMCNWLIGASSLWAFRQLFVQYLNIHQTVSGESLAQTPRLLPILQISAVKS